MADTDIGNLNTSNLTDSQDDYSVSRLTLDGAKNQNEIYWYNSNFSKYLGYYKQIPELKQAVDSLAMWSAGKGYETDTSTKIRLDNITGWGEDSFQSIMINMIKMKKINGDSFAEIIRNDKGNLINLKPLNPANIRVVADKNGIIKRYDQLDRFTKKKEKEFKPTEILHLVNGRVGDEIHGISVIEACEEIILARNEAITDYRKVLHRNINPLKIFQIDEDDTDEINTVITKYQNMTKDYEALFVPKGNMDVDIPNVPLQSPLEWIRYLENVFYQAVGVPKIILGGSQEFTEASSKVGYLTFEQVYMTEQQELESDLWHQLAIKLTFNRPVSLMDSMKSDEEANTGQTGFQPKEAGINMERE